MRSSDHPLSPGVNRSLKLTCARTYCVSSKPSSCSAGFDSSPHSKLHFPEEGNAACRDNCLFQAGLKTQELWPPDTSVCGSLP